MEHQYHPELLHGEGGILLEDDEEDSGMQPVLPQWTAKRHLTGGNPKGPGHAAPLSWRLKSRLKTHAAALVVCLNISVDPPDIVKTKPCAKLECWVDPTGMRPDKALEEIGKNLQKQFETLSQKVRYKLYLDPAFEDTKKLCTGLRKLAKEERVLFYYNGHGVPAPTPSGEIWVFNKSYTQYIPVSLFDLQEWLGSPCIFVWDCSSSGHIINNFNRWADRRDADAGYPRPTNGNGPTSSGTSTPTGQPALMRDCIQLAACGADEVLPMNPDLPADLFTCCLTTPIEIALRYFVLQDPLKGPPLPGSTVPRPRWSLEEVLKIPGDLKDRKTPLGELNWIFTSVTDTIAWLMFPKETFRRLFRQDLLLAALFRNYLLAERVMRTYGCTPRSSPTLPPTHQHHLWASWDTAVEGVLVQLPDLLKAQAYQEDPSLPPFYYKYQPSTFYVEHLTALHIWLFNSGISAPVKPICPPGKPVLNGKPVVMNGGNKHDELTALFQEGSRQPPDQLPIVLQVLLSQAHRTSALIHLSKFVDLGPWAVHQALEIGIFPYVQRLLQSPAFELKPVLIFIWARILAIDQSCQIDLLKDSGFTYFSSILSPYSSATTPGTQPLVIPNDSEHYAMCAFILSIFCRSHRAGQQACLGTDVFQSCLHRMKDDDYLLRQWAPLCIAQLWAGFDDAKSIGLELNAPYALCELLRDDAVEVRAAVLYALGTFLGASGSTDENSKGGGGSGCQLNYSERQQFETEIKIALATVIATKDDASPLVRKEIIVVLSCVVREWRGWFLAAAWIYWQDEDEKRLTAIGKPELAAVAAEASSTALRNWMNLPLADSRRGEEDISFDEDCMLLSSCHTVFVALLELSVDPYDEVSSMACTVIDYITALLLNSAFLYADGSTIRPNHPYLKPTPPRSSTMASSTTPSNAYTNGSHSDTSSSVPSTPLSAIPPNLQTHSGISRTSSIAARLMTMAGIATPSSSPPEPSELESNVIASSSSPALNHAASSVRTAQYRPPYVRAFTEPVRDASPRREASEKSPFPPCTPQEVIEALVQEDMERLRIRRLAHSEAGGGAEAQRPRAGELGIGLIANGVKDDILPLRSKYFDFSLEYYQEPQMKQTEADEAGSVAYNEQIWRRQRNEQMVVDTAIQSQKLDADYTTNLNVKSRKSAPEHPWNKIIAQFDNEQWPMKMVFHPFESHVAVTDTKNFVSVWDWKTKSLLNRFSNGKLSGVVTSVEYVNETGLMLTASTEGNIRIYRNYDSPDEFELAAAFRGLSIFTPSSHPSGIVTNWNQLEGRLNVGGDSHVVRVWDAHRELPIMDMLTQGDSCVTSLSSEQTNPSWLFAGFGDGSVRQFDTRMGEADSLANEWRKHRTWVQNVTVQRNGNTLVTASMDGECCVWDVRNSNVPVSEVRLQQGGMSSMAVHQHASLIASVSMPTTHSSYQQRIQLLNIHHLQSFTPRKVSTKTIPVHKPVPLHPRPYAPWMNAMAFHPNELMVGLGEVDGQVLLIKPDKGEIDEFSK